MKLTICSAICILAIFNLQESSAATDKVVCYFGSWSTYRNGKGKFDVENINPNLCTHLIYTFVGLSPDGTIRILDEYNDLEENWGKGSYKRFNKLKEINPNLKTIIAIGGWNEGSVTYSNVMADDTLRARFVQNVVDFVTKHGFDGFDFDWEYPAQRGGAPYDVENYSKVLRELRAVFDPRGLILSAAVASADFSVSQSYNVPELSKYLDIINVMTYDLHGPWDKITGLHTGLYPSSTDVTEIEKQLNVAACIDTWIRKGADPSKINLGLAMYGKTFTLDNPANNGLKAPAANPGRGGHYTYQDGMLGYNEIVELQLAGGWTKVWDNEQLVPYMYKGNQWVSYDDPESIKLKVEYAKSKGLGGVLLWSIETDDFHGVSGTKYPLLQTINIALGKPNNTEWTTTTTTQKPIDPNEPTTTTTTQAPSSTENPGVETPDSLCKKEGYMRDPINCSIFYYCMPFGDGFRTYEFQCSDGLVFDVTITACNYRWNTNC